MANKTSFPPKPTEPPLPGYRWVCKSFDDGYEYWWDWIQIPIKEDSPND